MSEQENGINQIDYKKMYRIFKVLPTIAAIATLIAGFVLGIIFGGVAILVGLLVGVPLAAVEYVITAVIISPTVLRTDAAISLLEVGKNRTSITGAVDTDDLPEL